MVLILDFFLHSKKLPTHIMFDYQFSEHLYDPLGYGVDVFDVEIGRSRFIKKNAQF